LKVSVLKPKNIENLYEFVEGDKSDYFEKPNSNSTNPQKKSIEIHSELTTIIWVKNTLHK
jgi:hypothetical protein